LKGGRFSRDRKEASEKLVDRKGRGFSPPFLNKARGGAEESKRRFMQLNNKALQQRRVIVIQQDAKEASGNRARAFLGGAEDDLCIEQIKWERN